MFIIFLFFSFYKYLTITFTGKNRKLMQHDYWLYFKQLTKVVCAILLSAGFLGMGGANAAGLAAGPRLSAAGLPEWVVKGKVTDEKGNAMPGVTVQVQGTTTGVVTNSRGEYIITVSSTRAVLVVSSVGYQQQHIPVDGKKNIPVSMKPANTGINEVVVVGYG